MRKRDPIVRFLIRFVSAFMILAIPWPGVNHAYSCFLRGLEQAVFSEEDGRRELSFEAQGENSKHPYDTRIVIANRALLNSDGSGPAWNLDVGFGWLPMALLLALIFATPVSWFRRGWAMVWEGLAYHGFVLLSLSFIIWTESAEIGLVTFSPFWKHAIDGVRAIITQSTLSAPVLIWLLVTFRLEDLGGEVGHLVFRRDRQRISTTGLA